MARNELAEIVALLDATADVCEESPAKPERAAVLRRAAVLVDDAAELLRGLSLMVVPDAFAVRVVVERVG